MSITNFTKFNYLFLILFITSCYSAPSYKGPISNHFDGEKFYGKNQAPDKSLWNVIKMWREKGIDWPDFVNNEAKKVESIRVQVGPHITFINHATVLIQMDGLNILSDPMYNNIASPVSFAGPKRRRNPGIAFDDLPPIDIVIISHNHYDHLDIPTLQRLSQRDKPLILAGLGNSLLLKENGIKNYKDMDWGKELVHQGLRISFEPAQHWSARGLNDKRGTLWGSYVLHGKNGRVYFAGDTGYGPHFKEIHKKHGDMLVSLLPIGAYRPRWFMKFSHLNPAEALLAHRDLRSMNSVGIHFGTFKLTKEGIDDPVQDLMKEKKKVKFNTDRFYVFEFGEGRDFSRQ